MKRVHVGGRPMEGPVEEESRRDACCAPREVSKLAPVETWSPLMSLRSEMDRLFDTFFASVIPSARILSGIDPLRRWGLGDSLAEIGDLSPRIDLRETDGAFEISAELPGLCEKDVEVTYGEGLLSIKGEKKDEREEKGKGYYLNERRFGSFQRSFRIPEGVETDKIDAKFGSGVLYVTLPKTEAKEEAPKTKIEVRRAA